MNWWLLLFSLALILWAYRLSRGQPAALPADFSDLARCRAWGQQLVGLADRLHAAINEGGLHPNRKESPPFVVCNGRCPPPGPVCIHLEVRSHGGRSSNRTFIVELRREEGWLVLAVRSSRPRLFPWLAAPRDDSSLVLQALLDALRGLEEGAVIAELQWSKDGAQWTEEPAWG